MGRASTQPCPSCGSELPVTPGYVSWCHACGWNLVAPQPRRGDGPLDRLYQRAGARLGDRLAARLLQSDSLEARLTPARMAAYAIAATVHAIGLGLFTGGVVLLIQGLHRPSVLAVGVVAAAAGVALRPRLGKVTAERVLTRAEAPALFDATDRVAEVLQTRAVDRIVIDSEFNASWAMVGLRRRRVLTLGLPLLAALDPEERVAIIAHELAHGKNGDARRGLFVGSALRNLGDLYYLLAPGRAVHADLLTLPGWIANALLWLVSRPVLGLLTLELNLLLRDSQRAEYLADALAARAAGTQSVVRLHEKLLLEPTVRSVAQRVIQIPDEVDLFEEIRQAVESVPARERERRRRVARLETARLDATHPPTGLRIRLLEERPELPGSGDGADWDAIDAELGSYKKDLQHVILEDHRDRLYARYA